MRHYNKKEASFGCNTNSIFFLYTLVKLPLTYGFIRLLWIFDILWLLFAADGVYLQVIICHVYLFKRVLVRDILSN